MGHPSHVRVLVCGLSRCNCIATPIGMDSLLVMSCEYLCWLFVHILGIWASWCIITIIISVFANRYSFLYGRNEPLVRYCFLCLLYSRGERFIKYCFLWRSCADAGCHVYVPWVYHLAAKQGCTDVRVWLLKLGGLNIFCAHVLRGYLWASPIIIIILFFCRRWESN